jgi:hypothetical protein
MSGGGSADESFSDIREEGEQKPRLRKRSNSLPLPKAEVAAKPVSTEEAAATEVKTPAVPTSGQANGHGLFHGSTLEEAHHNRATSLDHKRRKKSMAGEGSKFKHFKSFVESKILSKSDRSLDVGAPPGGTMMPGPDGAKTISSAGAGLSVSATAAAGSASNVLASVKRRSSRLSLSGGDLLSSDHQLQQQQALAVSEEIYLKHSDS